MLRGRRRRRPFGDGSVLFSIRAPYQREIRRSDKKIRFIGKEVEKTITAMCFCGLGVPKTAKENHKNIAIIFFIGG